MKTAYVIDRVGHLICVPYSIENLHTMAEDLGLDRGYFSKNHYKVPYDSLKEVIKKCQVILFREIKEIVRHPEYAEIIISPGGKGNAVPQDLFWKTQIEYNG